MYQLIGISKVLKAYALTTAFLAVALATNLWGYFPFLEQLHLNEISAAVVIVTGIAGILGETPLFPVLCRWVPFFWHLFPCIEGEYTVEIASNWALISRRNNPDSDLSDTTSNNEETLFKKAGKATIKARLLSIHIKLEMDDEYSTSHTVACSVLPSANGAEPTLYYIYRNVSPVPKLTDSESHFGAARISVPRSRYPSTLKGTYWTDRNWHQGLNTAGQVRFQRT